MTVLCIRCNRVIFRYTPVEDKLPGLCDACASVQASREAQQLSCGRDECLLEAVPYMCLLAGAESATSHLCPAL